MTLPALEAVRDNFPSALITVLAKPWVLPLLESHPAVDAVIPLKKGEGGGLTNIVNTIRVSGVIRRSRFDLAILFQNAFEAAFLAYLGGIKLRIGYNTDGRKFLLSHTVIRNDEILKLHQVEYYLSILRAMGWKADTKDPELFVAKKDITAIHSLLLSKGIKEGDLLMGLSPGAIFGPAKRWPPQRFAVIGDRAVERWGAKVVILGSRREKDICMTLSRSMKYPSLNLCGRTTLVEAAALIRRCNFFLTNDSGLMHISAALNIPMVAIFGSTDSSVTGPRSQKARVVRHPVECAPCFKKECPLNFRCMSSIQTDDIWEEMEKLKQNEKTGSFHRS